MTTIYTAHADRLTAKGHKVTLTDIADVRKGDRVIVDIAMGVKPRIAVRPVLDIIIDTLNDNHLVLRHEGNCRYGHYYTAPQVYVVS